MEFSNKKVLVHNCVSVVTLKHADMKNSPPFVNYEYCSVVDIVCNRTNRV